MLTGRARRQLAWGVGACLVVGFVAGMVRLLELQFAAGNLYPPYSSFRSDPLGTRALHEGLARLPEVTVSRLWQPLRRLPANQETVLWVLGVRRSDLDAVAPTEWRELEGFLHGGGRVVLALVGETEERRTNAATGAVAKTLRPDDAGRKPPGEDRKREIGDEAPSARGERPVSMRTQWGVGIGFEALPNQGEDAVVPVAVERIGSQQLPTRLSWRSGLYFELPPTNWSVIYARGKQPVMVERRFGQGSLVMMSDAYLLSNEGLYRERELGLVSWLVGSRRRVWFDEAHLGVVSNPGVSVLVRRYRLHGAVAALVLLAGLFAWQQAARFLPTESRPEGRGESAVRGRDSGTGYLTLLKRHVRPEDLAVVCWEEWRRDCGRTDAAAPEARLEVAEALVKMESMRLPRDRDPVATCRALAEALNARAGGVVPGTEDQSHER